MDGLVRGKLGVYFSEDDKMSTPNTAVHSAGTFSEMDQHVKQVKSYVGLTDMVLGLVSIGIILYFVK